ncbi:MAG: radical SAM protein [Syntrophobacteraceae bacterium]|nr:radical SAM protein [Syntrophobacteraceae bacterium]
MFMRKKSLSGAKGSKCLLCGELLPEVARCIGICPTCVRNRPRECRERLELVHAESREMFGLPTRPPANPEGIDCELCVHRCRPGRNQKGYCGVRHGSESSMRTDGRTRALVSFYRDPLPTNCVADWVCAGGTGEGYPDFANECGPEVGFYNLAVSLEACNLNCLFCRNWTFRKAQLAPRWTSIETLGKEVDESTSCICFLGGDPGPQLPYAVRLSEEARNKNPGRILRICWETNGALDPSGLKKMIGLAVKSGGCVKIDLKAWNPSIHRALCGIGNSKILENFARAAEWASKRPSPPALVASTTLIPEFIDEEEIYGLASFIARIDPDIPYALLAFAPQFLLDDSPTTSTDQALACLKAAKLAGLTRVRLGNEHLLS